MPKKKSSPVSVRLRTVWVILCCSFILGFPLKALAGEAPESRSGSSDGVFWSELVKRAADEAWEASGFSPSPEETVVLTNAGHAVVGGHTTEACLDALARRTGTSIGSGRLLPVHSARTDPLWFFFYDTASGNGVFWEARSQALVELMNGTEPGSGQSFADALAEMPENELRTRMARENIRADKLLEDPQKANRLFKGRSFGGHEFAVVTLANLVAHGAPFDLIRSSLYHDHLCPGVTSGYLLAGYLEEHFFENTPSEKRFTLSMPPWCKDDALLTLLNTTPGKRSFAVVYLNDEDKERLPEKARNLAGVFFRKANEKAPWQGCALAFSFEKAQKMSGVDFSKGFGWESRLKLDLWLLDHLDRPELFIETLAKVTLPQGRSPSNLARPGTDPLKELGLVKQ